MTYLEPVLLIWAVMTLVFIIGWHRLRDEPEVTTVDEFLAACEREDRAS